MKKTGRMLADSKNSRTFASLLKTSTLEKRFGEMAEWSIAAVLKTVVLRGTGGSNPSLSARKSVVNQLITTLFIALFQRNEGMYASVFTFKIDSV